MSSIKTHYNVAPFKRHAEKLADTLKLDPLTILAIISLLVNILRLWFEMRKAGPICRAIMRTRAMNVIYGKHDYLPYRVRRYMANQIVGYLLELPEEELKDLELRASEIHPCTIDPQSTTTS